MKRQELRDCFDRIRPREELIRSTLERINGREEARSAARVMPTYAFATRLAGALCALLLLIGIGVLVGRDAIVAPDTLPASDERMAPMTIDGQKDGGEPTAGGAVLVGCEQMIEDAKAYGSAWAVCSATVDAVYFKSETEGIATLSLQTVADCSVSDWTDGEQTLVAAFDAVSEDMRALVDRMGEEVLVALHTESRDGESVWVIHEVQFTVSPVE